MKQKKIIALFDFDGTISNKDTLLDFIRFAVGDIKTLAGMLYLSPTLIAYKLNLIANDVAKESVLSYFFRNMDKDLFKEISQEYSLYHIDNIVRLKAMKRIVWHKQQGHTVLVISASIACWLQPWCDKYKLELIATQLEMKNNIVTGKLLTNNCYGIEKTHRLYQQYNLDHFDYIYAYGDSRGDKELLALANESFYKPFRK